MQPANTLDLLRSRRQSILELARKYHAENLRVFGSVLRGDDGPDSDVDLLVDWPPGVSLMDWSGLQQELSDLLQRRVDLVSADALHWAIRQRVLEQARPLP